MQDGSVEREHKNGLLPRMEETNARPSAPGQNPQFKMPEYSKIGQLSGKVGGMC